MPAEKRLRRDPEEEAREGVEVASRIATAIARLSVQSPTAPTRNGAVAVLAMVSRWNEEELRRDKGERRDALKLASSRSHPKRANGGVARPARCCEAGQLANCVQGSKFSEIATSTSARCAWEITFRHRARPCFWSYAISASDSVALPKGKQQCALFLAGIYSIYTRVTSPDC